MSFVQRVLSLIGRKHRTESLLLIFLVLLGTILEAMGLGSIFPLLTIISKPEIINDYPTISDYLIRFSPGNFVFLSSFNLSDSIKILFSALILFFLLIGLKTFIQVILSWRRSCFVAKLKSYWMGEILNEYLYQPYIFHLKKNSANLIKNVESSTIFSSVIGMSIVLLIEIFVFISFSIVLFIAEPIGFLVVFFTFLIAAYAFSYFSKKKMYLWGGEVYHNNIYALKHMQQALGGIKETKLLGKEEIFKKIYNFHNVKVAGLERNMDFFQTLPKLWLELLFVMLIIFLVVLFSLQGKSIITILPVMGIFAAAGFRLVPSVNRILTGLQYLSSMVPPVEIIYDEYLKIRRLRDITKKVAEPIEFKKSIKLEKIEFYYDSKLQKVLSSINLEISKGQIIGFFGESGAGKSTLIEIIGGLLEPSSGSLKIDDAVINSSNLGAWQRKIGYVPQNVYLLDDSIRKNIAFGLSKNEIEDDKIYDACRGANLYKFIDSLPQKLDTSVGERGTQLSAGQRQRIGIARTLYYDPEVIIFDEATNNLDTKNEEEILKLISSLKKDKTILMISHRESAIKTCDFIYYLDSGRIKN